MTWLIAVVLKPWFAVGFFGFACAIAYAIRPLFPEGRVRDLLYDRSLRLRHPVIFGALVVVSVYGTILFMDWYVMGW